MALKCCIHSSLDYYSWQYVKRLARTRKKKTYGQDVYKHAKDYIAISASMESGTIDRKSR